RATSPLGSCRPYRAPQETTLRLHHRPRRAGSTTGRPSRHRRDTRVTPTPAIPSRDGTSTPTPRRETTSRDTDTGATASLATTSPAVRRPAMAVIRRRATDDRDTASSPAIRARTTATPALARRIYGP